MVRLYNDTFAACTCTVPLASSEPAADADAKGKGQAKAVADDEITRMSKSQVEAEIKELEGLKEDLALKASSPP